MELRTHDSIRDVGERTWNELASSAPPFLSFTWLDALETTGCVRPERGWLPMHLTLEEDGRVLAAAPAYVKGNSEGEFVFDYAWASHAEGRLGLDYYPKLVVAVPFTPATGPRLLSAPGADPARVARAFAEGLAALAERIGASGAHVLFPSADEADRLEAAGMARRAGIQFHWENAGFASFDDFLQSFDAKKRHQLRRERREVAESGLCIESMLGSALSSARIDSVYELYLTTVDKFVWGRRYLTREFFHEVCAKMGEQIHLVFAREASGGEPIAGAFNLLGRDALYGRYWGAREERRFLHFEVCYYRGIQDCIERGLARFEPGAGGEHKAARGFLPTVTHSTHLLLDRRLDLAVRDFLQRERAAVIEHVSREQALNRRCR
ncbi:MAG: N-acetyltransferase [Myxococcales bacterium]|nr:N-acetyltransferase [Myxococcales bacterium]